MLELGALDREITPLTYNSAGVPVSAVDLFGYNSPYGSASNTPLRLEESNTAVTFFYDDQTGRGLSLFLLMDRFQDSDGGRATIEILSNGLAQQDLEFTARNDPGDSTYHWRDSTGSADLIFNWWPCCNDGFVLEHITGDDWDLTLNFIDLEGIDRFSVLTQDSAGGVSSIFLSAAQVAAHGITLYEPAVSVSSPANWPLVFSALALAGLFSGGAGRKTGVA